MGRSNPLPLVLLAVSLLVVSYVPMPAAAQPPDVTEILHIPKYPHVGDPVNVTARVETAIGIDTVMLFYCALGGGVCQHWVMFDLDSDNVYNQTATPIYLDSIGGDYYIVAIDTNGDSTMTNTTYVQYALSVNATATSDRQEVFPGGKFNLTVDAHYWNNYSAPTENSSVDINRVGSTEHWIAKTDSAGKSVVEITAPSTVGTYVYNATISNNSPTSTSVVTGYAEASVLVLIEPMPDLVVRPQDIVFTPFSPYEGDNVTANITIRNIGNENETFWVLIVINAGGVNYTLANVSAHLHAWNVTGNSTTITVWWDAYLGPQALNITIDPGNPNREASEDNNFASVLITGMPIPHPDNKQDSSIYLWIMVIVMLLAVMGAAIVMIVRRRRTKETPAETEEKPEESEN